MDFFMSNNSRVYYGEYSLKHWIDLILQGNIKLPDYQRSFVWQEEDVKRMILSLYNGLFVPPVTIAHYKTTTGSQNLIVDGQQRLTSIFLLAVGFVPDRDKFEEEDIIACGDDSREDEDGLSKSNQSVKWTFDELVRKHLSLDSLRSVLNSEEKYLPLHIKEITDVDDFLRKTFLGFSYIVPDPKKDQNAYFATLFRNINYWGIKLSSMESRRSLYYMNADLVRFFDGKTTDNKDVLCNIDIQENLQPSKIDFVRYVSILSQYSILGNANKVLVGYSAYSARELFYADYVSYIVGIEQGARQDKFNGFDFKAVFPDSSWNKRFDIIRETIGSASEYMELEQKNKHRMFVSWIDADYWLFGLLYFILFEGKKIDIKNDKLIATIREIISTKKISNDGAYAKSPNRLGNLRERINESIGIYKDYVL